MDYNMLSQFFKKPLTILAFLLLVFLSLFPRCVEVLNKNYIFLLDQGRDYMGVKNIVVNRKATLIGSEVGGGMAGIQGVFHGPLHFYLLSIPFVIFNGDPYGGVLLMFIFGILTIGTAFFVGRKIFGSAIGGILTSFFVSFCPPLIAQSRFVWNPHPSSLFILIAFYFTYLMFQKKTQHFFLAALFTGVIYNFETAIAAIMGIALIVYSIFLLRIKHARYYLFVLAGFITSYIPLILFEFRHNFQALNGAINYLFFRTDKGKVSYIFNHLNSFYLNFIDTFPKQFMIPEILFLTVFVVFFITVFLKEKNSPMHSFFMFLLLLVGLTFFILSFVRNFVFPYYLIHLNFVYILIFSYTLIVSYRLKQVSIQIVFSLFFILFLWSGITNAIKSTLLDYPDYGGMVKIKGKREAIEYIYRDAGGSRFGLLIFSPPVYTYPYDYLIWWYGNRQFNYVPHKEKRGLFYLLIEKDLSAPWTYEGWLKTVVKTGKVISTKELPSGFIIQKRIADETP